MPLYDEHDVELTLPLFSPVALHEPVTLSGGVTGTLRRAGHILGSSTVTLECGEHRVLFSGDLGRPHHPLLRSPEDPPAVNTIVVESTYGDRSHPVPDPSLLADAVRRTVKRGGSVLIPAFAVDRTELVLLELQRLMQAAEIPQLRVFVDSPMALSALAVYRRAAMNASPQIRGEVLHRAGVLEFENLEAVRTPDRSKGLNRPEVPCIVISASGMASGGRVVHHLAHQLPDHRNTVVLTGYQAQGTRGRSLLDGARQVKIHGHYVPVRAEIVNVPDFSVHSDSDETMAWLSRAPEPPSIVYVVHGEARPAAQLAQRITRELGWCAVVPEFGERVLLD